MNNTNNTCDCSLGGIDTATWMVIANLILTVLSPVLTKIGGKYMTREKTEVPDASSAPARPNTIPV